jgi:ribosomal protein S27AE
MREILAIPIFYKNSVYPEIEIEKPRPGVIADTQKMAESGNHFAAILTFISGCVSAIYKDDGSIIQDAPGIKSLVGQMAYKSAEVVTIQIMLLHNGPDDAVEGFYTCPRCGGQVLAEYVEEDGETKIDTTDHIRDLKITYMTDYEESIYYKLNNPVEIINAKTKEPIEVITDFEIYYPTLNNCIAAYRKNPNIDSMRLQFAIYVEALRRVNGIDITDGYKNLYGMLIFLNMPDAKTDLFEFTKLISFYGIDKRVEKTCPKCGKIFKVILNTSNFFVSALDT